VNCLLTVAFDTISSRMLITFLNCYQDKVQNFLSEVRMALLTGGPSAISKVTLDPPSLATSKGLLTLSLLDDQWLVNPAIDPVKWIPFESLEPDDLLVRSISL
jgi:hypothetical protein